MIVLPTLASRLLAGNPMGDPNERRVLVCLPDGYESNDRRYPTLYFLPGFAARGSMLVNDDLWEETLPDRITRLIRTGVLPPIIFVSPDCSTRLGGSQYIDSAATGRYGSYLTDEVVPWVDTHYRTIPEASARAVMGKSSGGYGALILGMQRPDLFSNVIAHSADMAFELCYRPDFPLCAQGLAATGGSVAKFLSEFPHPREKRDANWFDTVNILAMASCYSPDRSCEGGFALPFDPRTCELDDSVWQTWLKHDPLELIARHSTALRSLQFLFFDCGNRDEHHLHFGARRLNRELTAQRIAHQHEEFTGGHRNTAYRYDRSLFQFAKSASFG